MKPSPATVNPTSPNVELIDPGGTEVVIQPNNDVSNDTMKEVDKSKKQISTSNSPVQNK